MLLYEISDDQKHFDVVATLSDAKQAVKHIMWDKGSTWITEIEVPQDKANVLALVRAMRDLPSEVTRKETGREWWVTARGGVKEHKDESSQSE